MKQQGFTFIELVIFMVVLAIIGVTLLFGSRTALRDMPLSHQETLASEAACRCLDYYFGQRYLGGFTNPTLNLTGGAVAAPSFCTVSGYSTTVNIGQGADANQKIITVTVNGNGTATLKLLITNY